LLFVVFVLALGMMLLLVHYLGVVSSSFFSARDLTFSQALETFLSQHAVARVAVTVVTASLVFLVLLRYFAKKKVQLRYVFAGGLLFSILWMLAGRLFGYYLNHIAQFSLLYGSLATLAIIVVWIFYSAIILLLCTEFTRDLQEYRLLLHDRQAKPQSWG
jgi:YihY family inner membrane protein